MPATGEYDTVKSTPSITDYSYAHVLEYKSYVLSILVILYLKDILGLSFLFGGNKECKNSALNVVVFAIFS